MFHIDISRQVAKARIEQGSKTNFWLKTSRNLFDSELYKNIIIYAATIKSVFPRVDEAEFRPNTWSFDGLLEIIAEYTLGNAIHEIKNSQHERTSNRS